MNLRADKIIIFALATILPSFAQQAEEFSKNCATLSRPGTYPDYDPLPNYRIEKREYDAAQPPGLNLRISMPSRSLEGAAIIRVGCKLISDFQHENQIHALLFDDGAAARKLAPMMTDQHDHGIFLWHLKARFELNKQRREAFVEYVLPEYRDGLLALRRIRYTLLSDQLAPGHQ